MKYRVFFEDGKFSPAISTASVTPLPASRSGDVASSSARSAASGATTKKVKKGG